MNYKINPLAFTDIFAVPGVVVDENLRLASAIQLRTLLYLLRHANDPDMSLEAVSKAVGHGEEEVSDALIFWNERGLLLKDDSMPLPPVTSESFSSAEALQSVQVNAQTEPSKPVKKAEEIPVVKPSHEQVAARLNESEELRCLFKEAQSILGKTVGYDGQSTLIMMHDSYGLPVEVILMAIQYSMSKGKSGFAAISRIGRQWSENEIDTLEAAMEYIESHNIVDETWDKLRRMTEITNKNPTAKQQRFLNCWVKEYGYNADMIYFAYEEAVDNTGKINFDYMDKVLLNWHKNDVKTPQDIQKEKLKWQQQSKAKFQKPQEKKKAPGERREPTFSVDDFTKKAIDLKYVPPTNDN